MSEPEYDSTSTGSESDSRSPPISATRQLNISDQKTDFVPICSEFTPKTATDANFSQNLAENSLKEDRATVFGNSNPNFANFSQNLAENSCKKDWATVFRNSNPNFGLPPIHFSNVSDKNTMFEFKGNLKPKVESSRRYLPSNPLLNLAVNSFDMSSSDTIQENIDDRQKNELVQLPASSIDLQEHCIIPSDWRKTRKNHTERMEYLLESGFLSDVTFTVGPEKTEIKGHRAILAIGSPVFQVMLTGKSYVEGQPIHIPDLTPFRFKTLLKYLYTGEMHTWGFVYQYIAAKKFSVDELTQKCVEELIASLTKENVCSLYGLALAYEEVKLEKMAEDYILKNARYLVETDGFLLLSKEDLEKIISSDELQIIDEIQLIKAVYNWGKSQCKNQKMEIPADNIRLILKPLISHIRIPLLDASSFSIHVAPLEILSEKELISSLLFFNVSKSTRSTSNMTISGFSSKPRNYFKPTGSTRIFQIQPKQFTLKEDECESIEHSGNWSSTNFSVDKEIWIKSIGLFLYNYQDYIYTTSQNYRRDSLLHNENEQDYLKSYTTNSLASQYICKLKIEEGGMSQGQNFVEKILKGSWDSQEITFETPIYIMPNKEYTISLFTVGPATLGIRSGQVLKRSANGKNGKINVSFLNSTQNPAEILKIIANMKIIIE